MFEALVKRSLVTIQDRSVPLSNHVLFSYLKPIHQKKLQSLENEFILPNEDFPKDNPLFSNPFSLKHWRSRVATCHNKLSLWLVVRERKKAFLVKGAFGGKTYRDRNSEELECYVLISVL